jgi:hypothetical protein
MVRVAMPLLAVSAKELPTVSWALALQFFARMLRKLTL